MTERTIRTLRDIAQLTPDEFQRFLPDFAAWHEFAHAAEQMGFAYSTGMQWVDDEKAGVITHVDLTHDGKTMRFPVEGGAA